MPPKVTQRLYDIANKLADEKEAAKRLPLPKHLEQPESFRRSIPLGREVPEAELRDWLEQICSTNKWVAQTHRNVDLICKTFLFDDRIRRERTLQDLVAAVKIADAQYRLDRTPEPGPPQFEDSSFASAAQVLERVLGS
jgi:hypothetical protein